MSLQDWLRNGWLVEHKTSPAEIAELLAITVIPGTPYVIVHETTGLLLSGHGWLRAST